MNYRAQAPMPLFWEKHKIKILSLIIAIYSLPLHFSRAIPYSYDGGWMTSLNLAIRDKLVFGKDFIFTYGPLGTLSTRCNLYVNNLLLLAGDLFFLFGCFHFLYRHVLANKGWFVIALITMLIFRTTVFSQSLFVIFIIYAALNLLNNFKNNFELAYCGLAGVLLFFIKINYGMLAITGLAVLGVIIAFRAPRKLIFFLLISTGLFATISWGTHISVTGYFKNSLEMMTQYDEAGYWPIKRSEIIYISGVCMEAVIACILCYFAYSTWKKKTLNKGIFFFLCCLAAASLVLYRNAYTRADFYHYGEYFATMPFLILATIVMCGLQQHMLSKVTVFTVACFSWYNLVYPDIADNTLLPKLKSNYYYAYFSPVDYVKGIFEKREKKMDPIRLLSKDKIQYIGNKTVDIIPWETELLHFYNFNYHPRPLPQTCGYAGFFDSLNAAYFSGPNRPELVMIQNFPIDYKYFFWEEPMSKTSLRLNYRYDGFAGVNGRDSLKNGYFDTYLLLEHRGDTQAYPKFEKIGTRTARLNEKIKIDFPPDEAVYMTVHFKYTTRGMLRRMFFQPPNLHVFFYYDDGNRGAYRVSVPALNQPVLVNKVIQNQEEMKHFYAGELQGCRNMKIFFFHAINPGFEQEYTIEFFKLKNY